MTLICTRDYIIVSTMQYLLGLRLRSRVFCKASIKSLFSLLRSFFARAAKSFPFLSWNINCGVPGLLLDIWDVFWKVVLLIFRMEVSGPGEATLISSLLVLFTCGIYISLFRLEIACRLFGFTLESHWQLGFLCLAQSPYVDHYLMAHSLELHLDSPPGLRWGLLDQSD